MKKCLTVIATLVLLSNIWVVAQKGSKPGIVQLQGPQNPRLGFVIHGGAGVISKGSLTPEKEKEFRAKLEEAVLAGYRALQAGKSSLDAVEIAIRIMNQNGKTYVTLAIPDGASMTSKGIIAYLEVQALADGPLQMEIDKDVLNFLTLDGKNFSVKVQ